MRIRAVSLRNPKRREAITRSGLRWTAITPGVEELQSRELLSGLTTAPLHLLPPMLGRVEVPATVMQQYIRASISPIQIHGRSFPEAGITDGTAQEDQGRSWNGWRVLNDRQGTLTWDLSGNFPAARGSVLLNGRPVKVSAWSTQKIVIDPTTYVINTQSWVVAPTRGIDLVVQDSSGRVAAATKVDIVPAINTRVYGQCTWWVAYRRLQMGLNISPTAYKSSSSIGANWVPHAGDQLQFRLGGGYHAAIIESVSPPSVKSNVTTYTLTISERNADGKNGANTYTTTFQVSGQGSRAAVLQYPRSSIGSAGVATLYYAWNR